MNPFLTNQLLEQFFRNNGYAFGFRLSTVEVLNSRNFLDVREFLNNTEIILTGNIRRQLARHNNLKVSDVVFAEYIKQNQYQRIKFKTRNEIITPATNLGAYFATVTQMILNEVEDFKIRVSQWVLNRIFSWELGTNRYTPLRGRYYVPLPSVLANKKTIINVQNQDNKYFQWAVLSALHPAKNNPQRVSKYKQWQHEFDNALSAIEFPVKLPDVSKLAKRTNMSINVHYFGNKSIFPLEITKEEKTHISIYYIIKSHYCWVQSLEKLVKSQITTNNRKMFICKMCLSHFYSKEKLNNHKTYCG